MLVRIIRPINTIKALITASSAIHITVGVSAALSRTQSHNRDSKLESDIASATQGLDRDKPPLKSHKDKEGLRGTEAVDCCW